MSSISTNLSDTIEVVRAEAGRLKPQFEFRLAWNSSYDGLLGGEREALTDIDEALERATVYGRVLIHAQAGAGKTGILHRLFLRALELKHLPVIVNLAKWTPPLFEQWEMTSGSNRLRLSLILHALGSPPFDETQFSVLGEGARALILVDGLNEVPTKVGQQLLEALDAFAFRNPSAGVVVTDRLARRMVPDERWQLARLYLTDDAGQPGAERDLSSIAFFRDIALNAGLDAASRSDTFRLYFSRLKLGDEALEALKTAAFRMYERMKSRSFELAAFKKDVGAGTLDALLEAGVVERSGSGRASFRHHLYHDYLASGHVAEEESLWTRDNFDALTFHASSFDAITMGFEQVSATHDPSTFIRRAYDWNFYASAYALATGHPSGPVAVAETQTFILAALAERRWDPLLRTAQRVTDALRLFPPAIASPYLSVQSLESLLDMVGRLPATSPDFQAWKMLYATSIDSPVPDDLVETIEDVDSIRGWTASNVLKRVKLTAPQQAYLRKLMAKDEDATVRWRAAHALGAHPSRSNVRALLAALRDPDGWVRSGSIRSLIEAAYRSTEDLRQRLSVWLQEAVPTIVDDADALRALEQAVRLREPMPDWSAAVGPVLRELWAQSRTVEEQDRWRKAAYEIQERSPEGASA